MTVVLVVAGALVGAPIRYLVDRAVQSRHDSLFPWGTFTVNVAGSFVLGVLVTGGAAGGVPSAIVTMLGTGFCGALTTYSTFGYETLRLVEERAYGYAALNAGAGILAGLGAAFCGGAVAQAVWG
jgi:CrcB protein